ncbi:unnamed protein product [Macrosiphum euphorbiae]|uniref:Uncharacterized protein n=1 Tax=Macrosiphum euphorbiae TaxID=13131 RepID=A0AAV0VYZ7_9HEMI|nr:unnamed protein product [Macrosiphum euphorbiae]
MVAKNKQRFYSQNSL